VHFSFRRNKKALAIFKVENGKCFTVPYSFFSVVEFSAPADGCSAFAGASSSP
jgi:hypothetical protein